MRRIIVATLTAALVVIGLSAVLVGTASAATPVLTVGPNSQECFDARNVYQAKYESTEAVRLRAIINGDAAESVKAAARIDLAAYLKVVSDARDAACGGSGSTPPSGRNCDRSEHWDNRLNRCVRDNNNGGYGGPRYNDCGEYNRNGIYDIRRGDARYLDSWDRNRNGVACDRDDIVVSNDGRCVTFRDQNRDYGTRYNSLYNERIDRARSVNSDGGTRITDSERRAISDAADLRDYRNRWTTTRDELRTICNDPTPEVIIIDNPTPSVTVTQAPPPPPAVSAPAPSSSGGGSIPRGPVDTGGDSVAFTLAHNRVA